MLGLVGFFVPDIVIGRGAATTTSDATEALLTFMDLVTLERLANSSATQSLHAAAAVSDQAVFVAIRDSLQRSRLEQRAPFTELKRLGAELELPALSDLADVMKLDDSGASLSDALRARVKELRDAHLTKAKVEASAISERMTFLMVIPSLIFGLLFLIPPLLRLLSSMIFTIVRSTPMTALLHTLIGFLLSPPRRDEKGLSQSTENALLLAGAVAVGMAIVTAVTLYVNGKLGELK